MILLHEYLERVRRDDLNPIISACPYCDREGFVINDICERLIICTHRKKEQVGLIIKVEKENPIVKDVNIMIEYSKETGKIPFNNTNLEDQHYTNDFVEYLLEKIR